MKKMNRLLRSIVLFSFLFLSLSCVTTGDYLPEQKTEFDQFVARANTPEKVASWIDSTFSYDTEKYRDMKSGRASTARGWHAYVYDCMSRPIEVYYEKTGVCTGWANFTVYILRKHGYDAELVYTRDPTHFVCAFKRAGKWWKLCIRPYYRSNHTQVVLPQGPYDTIKDVIFSINGKRRGGTFSIKK